MASVLGNTEEQIKAVETCRDWFEKDRDAKEFYVREMDENDKLYRNKHWDLLGPNGAPLRSEAQQALRPNAVENITFALVAGTVSEFAQNVDIVDFPIEASDEEVARVITELKQFLADKNYIEEERIKWLWNFFWHGTGIWEVVWDPYWRGGRGPNRWVGEIRWRSVHPRAIFPDARCGDDINRGRRIHKVCYVPKEYVVERFPEYGKLAREDAFNTDVVSSDPNVTPAQAQEDVVLLIETWYIGEPLLPSEDDTGGIGLHVIWWAGESNPVYLGHANYLYFADGEQPEFPFVFRQRYPRDGSVWGYGEVAYLKQPQIVHNKTIEILLEGHVHSALGQGFYEPGAMDEKQQRELQSKGTLPGMWFAVNDVNKVKRVYGQSMPSSLLQEAQRLPRVMEQLIGRFDVSQGRTPGSITAFRALDLLAQRAQVRLRSADVAITSGYRKVGEWINRHIWNHYTETRTYRIIGQNDKGLFLKKIGVFQMDNYRKVYNRVTGEVMPLSEFRALTAMMPELENDENIEVYAPELDVRVRTSQQMPSDRMFFMEVAKELYTVKLIDPETFFDVLENGRFPDWQVVKDRLYNFLQMQQGGGPVGQLPTQNVVKEQIPTELQELIDSLPTQTLQSLMNMPHEQQQALLASLAEQVQSSSQPPAAGI